MTKSSHARLTVGCRKALTAALAAPLVLAGSMFLAGSAQAAPAPSLSMGSSLTVRATTNSAVSAPLLAITAAVKAEPFKKDPAPPKPSKSPKPPVKTPPARTKAPVIVKAPIIAKPTIRPVVPTKAPTRAPAPQPTKAPAPAIAPSASPLSARTSVSTATPSAAPVSEPPWPTFVNTEVPQTFSPAGALGGTAGNNKGSSSDAQISLANEAFSGPGIMTWVLLLLGLTVVSGLAVAIYAMAHLRGRHQGSHREL